MKNIAILAVFILTLTTGFAQDANDGAWIALSGQGIQKATNRLTLNASTSVGNTICVQLRGDKESGYEVMGYVTFIEKMGTMEQIPALNSYYVYAHDSIKNVLVVGKFEKGTTADSDIRTIYSYNLKTGKFKELFDLRKEKLSGNGSGIWNAKVSNDTLFCYVNAKNYGGVGSNLKWVSKPLN